MAVKLPLELLKVCGENGLSRKSFFIDTSAYAEQRGEGRNCLAHPRHRHWVMNCHGAQELCFSLVGLCWVSRGRELPFSVCLG